MSILAPKTLDVPNIEVLRVGPDMKLWLRQFCGLLQQLFEMIAADVEIVAPGGVLQEHDIQGASHTAAGLTAGHVLRASAAAAFGFDAIQTDDLPDNIRVDGGAYYDAEVDNGDSGAADTINWTAGNKQKTTLTGDCTFTFTAPTGPCNVILKVVQGGVGSFVPVWPATVLWPSGIAPFWSTTPGAIDVLAFYFDGTNYFGQASINFVTAVGNIFWRFVQTASAFELQTKVAGVWTKVAQWQY